MTLEQLFYTLGIVFIVSWLLFLIALIVSIFILAKRFKQLKQNIKSSSIAAAGLKFVKPTSLKALIALMPMIQMGINMFRKKSKK